jgi:hypothetical protein
VQGNGDCRPNSGEETSRRRGGRWGKRREGRGTPICGIGGAWGRLEKGPPWWTVGDGSWWQRWHYSGGAGVAWPGLEAPVGGGEAQWRVILGGGRSGVGAPQ